jgi:hypothetical protein
MAGLTEGGEGGGVRGKDNVGKLKTPNPGVAFS